MSEPGRGETADPRQEPCPNCGDPTPGNYCPACGQRKTERRLTLRRVVREAVEDQFSLNSTFSRTLRTLLLHPGVITVEYLRGRIASYVPPFRLYLIASFMMFLVMQFADSDRQPKVKTTNTAADSAVVVRADSLETVEEDTSQTNLPLGDGALEASARAKLERIRQMETDEVNRLFEREFWNRIPIVIFLMVPVFAGMLALLYWRHDVYYVEHFIFALHVHAFGFMMLAGMAITPGWISGLLALWFVLYMFVALRRVYRQSTVKSLVKLGVLGIGYVIALTPALLLTILIAFIMLPV